MAGKKADNTQFLKAVRRAIREKLQIDTGLGKQAKGKAQEPDDPDEELKASKKIERKGYASAVSRR